jgi:hypothetical protein
LLQWVDEKQRERVIIMKQITSLLLLTAVLAFGSGTTSPAQDKTNAPASFEYGMIKWDGPDKVQIITPEHCEYIRVFKTGVKLLDDIHDEEFCDMWAMNHVAKDGWEPITIHATRIMMRRPTNR